MSNRISVQLKNVSVLLTGVTLMSALFAATAAPQTPGVRAEPTRTPTPKATEKPEPTRTPTPKPEPTKTPEPTKKPEPTRTPEPTKKPEPTRTPEPTKKPEPTKTPEPTKKPEPTKTPEPTRKPEPTKTPEPTKKPEPTPVPTPPVGSIAFAEPAFSVKENAGFATILVRRVVKYGVGAAGAVSVRYQSYTGGTATAGSDYTVVTGTLSWADGDGSVKSFRVPIVDDAVREPTETVFLRLYDLVGTGTIAPTRRTTILSILDNEEEPLDTIPPTVTINRPSTNARVTHLKEIVGIAKDEGGSKLASVGLTIRRLSDRKFWSGTEWVTREVILETRLNGHAWVRSMGNPAPPNLPSDFYQLTAIARDGAGNIGRFSEQVYIDATPPSLILSLPAPGAKLRALTRASGIVSDEDDGNSVVVFLRRAVDGKYWTGREWGLPTALSVQLAASGEWWRTEWPTLPSGNYSVTATATDALGNSISETHEFFIVAPSGGSA